MLAKIKIRIRLVRMFVPLHAWLLVLSPAYRKVNPFWQQQRQLLDDHLQAHLSTAELPAVPQFSCTVQVTCRYPSSSWTLLLIKSLSLNKLVPLLPWFLSAQKLLLQILSVTAPFAIAESSLGYIPVKSPGSDWVTSDHCLCVSSGK